MGHLHVVEIVYRNKQMKSNYISSFFLIVTEQRGTVG